MKVVNWNKKKDKQKIMLYLKVRYNKEQKTTNKFLVNPKQKLINKKKKENQLAKQQKKNKMMKEEYNMISYYIDNMDKAWILEITN